MKVTEFDPMDITPKYVTNKERIKLWVDALRSGKYKQTRKVLSDGEGYCCLGVACEVAYQNGLNISRVTSDTKTLLCNDTPTGSAVQFDRETGYLPMTVADWYGLDSRNPWVEYDGMSYTLIQLNDDGAFTFDDIADVIEKRFLPVEENDLAGVAA